MAAIRRFHKFDKDFKFIQSFKESQILQEFIPLEISKLKNISENLNKGFWLEHNGFYYVEFKPLLMI